MATLRIVRSRQYADMFRKYEILIDNTLAAEIGTGAEVIVPLQPGRHEVIARIDWCSSNVLSLDIEAEGYYTLEVGSSLLGWRLLLVSLYIFWKPNEYLYLKEATNSYM